MMETCLCLTPLPSSKVQMSCMGCWTGVWQEAARGPGEAGCAPVLLLQFPGTGCQCCTGAWGCLWFRPFLTRLVLLRPGLVECPGVRSAGRIAPAQGRTAQAAVSASIAAWLVLKMASEEVRVIPAFFLGEGREGSGPSLKKGREVTPCFGLWCTSPRWQGLDVLPQSWAGAWHCPGLCGCFRLCLIRVSVCPGSCREHGRCLWRAEPRDLRSGSLRLPRRWVCPQGSGLCPSRAVQRGRGEKTGLWWFKLLPPGSRMRPALGMVTVQEWYSPV